MEVSDVPPALRECLGTEATISLLELFDTARHEWEPEVTTAAIDRFDRRLGEEVGMLRAEMSAFRGEVREEINAFRNEVRDEMNAFRTEVRDEMNAFRTEVRDEINAFRTEVRDEINTFRSEVREELAKVRLDFANLRLDDAAARFELLKWCFVFWVGQVFAVAGVMALVLRLARG